MKKTIITSLSCMLLLGSLKSQVYAENQTYVLSSQTGECLIDQSQNCIDTDPDNFTLYQMNTLFTGEFIKQTLYFNQKMPQGSFIYIIIEDPLLGQINNQLLNSLSLSSENGSLSNSDQISAANLTITTAGQNTKYLITFVPDKIFDAVTLTLNSGITGALNSIRIYGAYLYPNFPITADLLELEATPEQERIIIGWKIGYELNYTNYTIERSDNGFFYEPIGTVQSNGYSSIPLSYQFVDMAPLNGINYYRIYVTDVNAEIQYFSPIAVRFTEPGSVSVYPNPSNGQHFSISVGENETEIQILDRNGKIMYQSEEKITGKIELNPDELGLLDGFYLIIAETVKTITTEKLIIR